MSNREKKDSTLRRERDRVLFDIYADAIRHHNFVSQVEAVEYVRKCMAPRFYIDGDFCNIVINRMLRGLECEKMGPNGRRKFAELFDRYKKMRAIPEYANLTPQAICDLIVDQPAPEFYISNRTARMVLAREKERRWKEGR